MMKEIENQQIYHLDAYHLRFFRIIYHKGSLQIKMDKKDQKMRTMPLENLK